MMFSFSFFSFRGKEPSSPEYHEQLLRLTKQLELRLYQSAPSFDAYLDMFTASRLKQLAVRVATETWPSCAQLVKAALQSTERNELQRQYEHSVAALQKEIDHVNNEKTTVDAQLNEALVELKAKESLIGDKEEALEQLQLLQQQRDTKVKSLKLQVLTMRAENTTLASEKAKAVNEATKAALESKSLFENVQTLNSKYDKLKEETQLMNVHIKAMEKDVVDCFLKDRKIKALSEKVKALTNAANEAVLAKADVVVQLEEATRALLARDSEIAAREQKIGALTSELDEAVTAKLALESESNRVQQQLDSLLRIDRKEDMKQLCKVIELNERIRSLQQAHDDALSSLRHEHEVVLSEKRSLEQERARRFARLYNYDADITPSDRIISEYTPSNKVDRDALSVKPGISTFVGKAGGVNAYLTPLVNQNGGRPPRLSSEGAIRGSDLTYHLHCMGSPTSMPMRFPGKFRERASRVIPASRPSNDSLRRSSFERPVQQSTSKSFESPHPRNNWIAPQETPTLRQTVVSCLET